MSKKILYITYDGLTDPLGQSQILPYLQGLSKHGYQFTILSFEKPDRLAREGNLINQLTKASGINWVPLTFTTQPPLLSKFYDAVRMRNKAVSLHKANSFDMVHCRSYLAADVGLHLKKKFGVKFFFDMRGFWADEKKDGSWNMSSPIYKRVYNYYKTKEGQYLQHADYIISLTNAGKQEMQRWTSFHPQVPVQVIPCCTDMEHFSLTSAEQKKAARQKLNIASDALVLSYLGSIGTWYMLDEMLALFSHIKAKYINSKFLFVTHTSSKVILEKAASFHIQSSDLIITEAPRKEVPALIKASDINISFIRPVYSKISSSPTKLGEVLSMGIPVITNSGVGDVEQTVTEIDGGLVLNEFNETSYQKAVKEIPNLLARQPENIRKNAEGIFSLEKGVQKYLACYSAVFR